MTTRKSYAPYFLFISLALVLALLGIGLAPPLETQAHPALGFTPVPDDNDGDGDSDDEAPTDGGDEGRTPTDYVLVRLDQCDLVCYEIYAHTNPADYELLAYSMDNPAPAPLLVPVTAPADVEIIAPVRLVHEGSGFIAEGALSTHRDTRISVPYPGKWTVFMTGQPRFMTAEAVDVTGTNMAQLQEQLSQDPVEIGVVEANSTQTQLIECPIVCVIETPPPPSEEPTFLPQTGHSPTFWLLFWLSGGIILVTLGLMFNRRSLIFAPVPVEKDD